MLQRDPCASLLTRRSQSYLGKASPRRLLPRGSTSRCKHPGAPRSPPSQTQLTRKAWLIPPVPLRSPRVTAPTTSSLLSSVQVLDPRMLLDTLDLNCPESPSPSSSLEREGSPMPLKRPAPWDVLLLTLP